MQQMMPYGIGILSRTMYGGVTAFIRALAMKGTKHQMMEVSVLAVSIRTTGTASMNIFRMRSTMLLIGRQSTVSRKLTALMPAYWTGEQFLQTTAAFLSAWWDR